MAWGNEEWKAAGKSVGPRLWTLGERGTAGSAGEPRAVHVSVKFLLL